ncbi:MAG: rod shape-determining protein RodA [Bacteroidales bacterium]|nr:rod shape-determining protein RodA [Bacteroidales bacterium]
MNFFKTFDWFTLLMYLALVVLGWFTINAASYTFDDASIFDFARPSGKQAVWFALAVFLIIFILSIDVKFLKSWTPFLYLGVMALLFVTIFIGTNINGSHSWIKIGTFSIQPAEFGKFSTSLMLAWLFSQYNFNFTHTSDFLKACFVILLPVGLIILQNETGSALVYFSLILLFYRQGMSGVVLWLGLCFVLIFVLGLVYGENLIFLLIPFMTIAMVWAFADDKHNALIMFGVVIGLNLIYYAVHRWVDLPGVIGRHFTYRLVGGLCCAGTVLYLLWLWLYERRGRYGLVALFAVAFIGFHLSVDYAFDHILQDHQRGRIEVLLGLKEDLKGAGYNVNQAKIAIGSGGLSGKGYLQGTQTKLAYVPEQETDFIFCTVGEEHGFVGSSLILLLYMVFILRITFLAERQTEVFSRVYAYCVACIFFFHVVINVGMVIGLMPVIGIPLPFFSYGGSGLWSFNILLFILLKLDASRVNRY